MLTLAATAAVVVAQKEQDDQEQDPGAAAVIAAAEQSIDAHAVDLLSSGRLGRLPPVPRSQ